MVFHRTSAYQIDSPTMRTHAFIVVPDTGSNDTNSIIGLIGPRLFEMERTVCETDARSCRPSAGSAGRSGGR